MAKNKTSKFDLNGGLFDGAHPAAHDVPVVHEVHGAPIAHEGNHGQPVADVNGAALEPNLTTMFSPAVTGAAGTVPGEGVYGTTQGKKGAKLKRINMAFGDEVYNYITFESRRRDISATKFVNQVLEGYMNSPEGHIQL